MLPVLLATAFGKDDGHLSRRLDRRGDWKDGEAQDDDNNAVRVEVRAFVKDKDFEGHRMMERDGRDGHRDHDHEDRRHDDRDGGFHDHEERRHDDRDGRFHDHEERRHDRRHSDEDGELKEQADDEGDAIRVEVRAYVKDKDFEGHRMMKRGGDEGHRGEDRRDHDDRRHDRVHDDPRDHDDRRHVRDNDDRQDHDDRRRDRDHDDRHDRRDMDGELKEQVDDEGDAIRVEVNAVVKNKAFEGHRMMERGGDDDRRRDHDDRRHDHDDRRRDHDDRRYDRDNDDRRHDRDHDDRRHDHRGIDGELKEQADDEGDAIRVEVRAYVKDKDFQGHRMMERGGDDDRRRDPAHPAARPGKHGPPPPPPAARPGKQGPPPPAAHHPFHKHDYKPHHDEQHEDRYGRETEDVEGDSVDVDVKAYVRDRDFNGRREMERKPGHRNFDNGNRMRSYAGEEEEAERAVANGEETGVEIHASIHGKDFAGHREMSKGGHEHKRAKHHKRAHGDRAGCLDHCKDAPEKYWKYMADCTQCQHRIAEYQFE